MSTSGSTEGDGPHSGAYPRLRSVAPYDQGVVTEPSSDAAAGTSIDVPCEVLAVTVARRRLVEDLLDAGADEWFVRDAVTVLGELLMNAMIHGTPDDDGRVRAGWQIAADGVATIWVRDSGGFGLPHLERPLDTEGGGRGLQLVDALSRSWGFDGGADGQPTVVTAVITPDGPSRGPARRPGSPQD